MGDAAAGCVAYLTDEFLLEQGFSYAGLGWSEGNPFFGYDPVEAVEILHNFATVLREDEVAHGMVGDVHKLYGVAVSLTTQPLHLFLHSEGRGLLDFSLLIVPSWDEETHEQLDGTNLVMVFLSESDLVRSVLLGRHAEALREPSNLSTYRSYEVTGGPHIPDVPWGRAVGPAYGIFVEGTTPLDWTPVVRALFVAGHRWATEGIEPPPSASFMQAPQTEIDPVYGVITGIARDENLNAQGGIRLPDLEIGRGQFIAVDLESFLLLLGDFTDLQCEPMPDGSARFRNHGSYVSQFARHTERLVAQGFLLPADADLMIAEAASSEVGKPRACTP
jgi:hypothetical protein